MIKLNGKEYAYRPEMSLKDLVDDYNAERRRLDWNGSVVLINGAAYTAPQAQGRTLEDNDTILFVPILDGG